MGRIVDIIVGRNGQIHAAIIDSGGFLRSGTRKIAGDWNALVFAIRGQAWRDRAHPQPGAAGAGIQARRAVDGGWYNERRRALRDAAPERYPCLPLLRSALLSKKRVPTTPSAGLGLMQFVETLTLSRTKTQVDPPAAVPDIAKAHS